MGRIGMGRIGMGLMRGRMRDKGGMHPPTSHFQTCF